MKFKALVDMPFNIKKGEEFWYTSDHPKNGTLRLRRANGAIIPGLNPLYETDFFAEVKYEPTFGYVETPIPNKFSERYEDVSFKLVAIEKGYKYLQVFVPQHYVVTPAFDRFTEEIVGNFSEWEVAMAAAMTYNCWAGYLDDKIPVAAGTVYYIRGILS